MSYILRDFKSVDADAVNGLALTAFAEFREEYSDWETFSYRIGRMASLAESGELIVASDQDLIIGAVVYVGPHKPKAEVFLGEWSILRMLVVDPSYRGQSIGRLLTQECINRAQRDKASVIALHTSPIMQAALHIYQRMGFTKFKDIEPICGVIYELYKLDVET